MQLSCIHLFKLASNLFYYARGRWEREWVNVDEQGKKRGYMPSLHLGQDLGGTTMEGNGWLRDSATHQNIKDLLIDLPLVLTAPMLCISLLRP